MHREYSMPTMMGGATVVVDQMGEVTLWASPTEELTMAPQVGDTNHGACGGPGRRRNRRVLAVVQVHGHEQLDGHPGRNHAAYMVMAGDEDYYLRVMATYTDAVGTDMAMVYSMPTMMVTAVAAGVLGRFDTDEDGQISKAEVISAISDYLNDVAGITKADVIEVINYYLDN